MYRTRISVFGVRSGELTMISHHVKGCFWMSHVINDQCYGSYSVPSCSRSMSIYDISKTNFCLLDSRMRRCLVILLSWPSSVNKFKFTNFLIYLYKNVFVCTTLAMHFILIAFSKKIKQSNFKKWLRKLLIETNYYHFRFRQIV